jgi:hypothetical protein
MKLMNGEGKRDAFCGARATVTGLAFPRKERAKVGHCNWTSLLGRYVRDSTVCGGVPGWADDPSLARCDFTVEDHLELPTVDDITFSFHFGHFDYCQVRGRGEWTGRALTLKPTDATKSENCRLALVPMESGVQIADPGNACSATICRGCQEFCVIRAG